MIAVLNAILPLFSVILIGFVAVRTGYVPAANIRPLGDLVIRIALPALIFKAVSEVTPGAQMNLGYILAYAAASLAMFGLGAAVMRFGFGRSVPQAAVAGLGVSASNSGFMGYPIVLALMGPWATTILAQNMVVENLIIIPLTLILLSFTAAEGGRQGLKPILWDFLRNPLVVALVAALVVQGLGLRLPAPVMQTFDILARMSSPAALFVIGGTLASLPLGRDYGGVGLLLGGKLILHPLATWAALSLVPGMDPAMLAGGVLFAAVPMVSIYSLLGQRAGLQLLTATALLAATVVCFGTIGFWIWVLGVL
ncbi:MAG: AEC family transporter [Pseudomonadota bacterium]